MAHGVAAEAIPTTKKEVRRAAPKRVAAGSGPGPGASRARQGQRFTAAQRTHAVMLARSGMKRAKVAALIGTTAESVRRWLKLAPAEGASSRAPAAEAPRGAAGGTADNGAAPSAVPERAGSGAPAVPGDQERVSVPGLAAAERAAILELKKKHPSYGPAQIRVQLRRFWGWRLSIKAIARVLTANGYELVWRGSRPRGAEPPQRFEAPRPNALWQLDFTELRLAGERLHLVVALDDFSRFVVGHALADSPSSQVATAVLRQAMARHGKPEAVRTDRGGAFLARSQPGDFAAVLEAELIDHIVGRPYHPQGGGKVEALIGTLRRELWDVEHQQDRATAERRIARFFEEYNYHRAHMGIDGLTPADRYHGRVEAVRAAVDAVVRGRQSAAALQVADGRTVEEVGAAPTGAPLEVLRLVMRDGVMELCFCGARVALGRVAA